MVRLTNNLTIFISILYIVFTLITPRIVNAAVFNIPSGNVNALINAINEANSNGEDDTIKLKAGTYTLTSVDNNTDGANGLPSISSKITINGAGADSTIIERQRNPEDPFNRSFPFFRIFHVATGSTLTLKKVTIKGGIEEFGGGILILTGSTLNIFNSSITDNIADGGGGGGIEGGVLGAVINITDSIIARNVAAGPAGCGGISGFVTITNSIITMNHGELGGGICGIVKISNSIISHNTADEDGGGILGGGEIHNSSISDNFAVAGGGILSSRNLTIINSNISDNIGDAEGGGGIFNSGTLAILNSTLAKNTSIGSLGGAIRNAFNGSVSIVNSTISENKSIGDFAAGGIFNFDGSVEIINTIVAGNKHEEHFDSESLISDSDCRGEVTSLGNNIIGDTTGCTITLQPSDLTGNPGLGDFTDNGTPGNGHFPLLATSQAIDAGNNDVCLNDPILTTDQIGNPRFGICDIGSIEFQPPFKNKGQCISTLIKQSCSGFKGKDRATCNHQQQQFCKSLFKRVVFANNVYFVIC